MQDVINEQAVFGTYTVVFHFFVTEIFSESFHCPEILLLEYFSTMKIIIRIKNILRAHAHTLVKWPCLWNMSISTYSAT